MPPKFWGVKIHPAKLGAECPKNPCFIVFYDCHPLKFRGMGSQGSGIVPASPRKPDLQTPKTSLFSVFVAGFQSKSNMDGGWVQA